MSWQIMLKVTSLAAGRKDLTGYAHHEMFGKNQCQHVCSHDLYADIIQFTYHYNSLSFVW